MRLLTGMLLCGFTTSVVSQQPASRRLRPSTQQAMTAVRRATVTIVATGSDSGGQGSGFIVTTDGVIATAAHVIHGASKASVHLISGEQFDVQGIVAIDEARDFALLRIPGFGLPTVALGNSDSVTVGAHLFAVGAPLGFEATVSDGLLSSTRLREGTRLFQVSIPISPGSSGGPVATDDGLVVALVVATWKEEGAQNLNFALPINYVRGEIPLASSKTPIPLSQVTYQPAGEGLRNAGDAATTGAPARVNDSLGVDWRVLDGVQLRLESKRDQGIRVMDFASYSLSRTPEGQPALERTTAETVRQTADILSGRKALTWYRENSRTVLEVGTGRVEFYWRREPASSQVAPGSLTLMLNGSTATVDSTGSHRNGVVPRGTLPMTLFGAVVAGLPDSLPSSVYVWFLNPSTSTPQAVPVRIDFGASEEMTIPVARPGTHCDPDSPDENTKDTTVEAVRMTATVGADRLGWPVLARRPHIRLEDAECVRLP